MRPLRRLKKEADVWPKKLPTTRLARFYCKTPTPSGAKIQEKMTFFQEQAVAGEKKRKEFMLMSATAQTSHVLGELGNQFAGIASNNKKLFALNKAFQIAQAIMQTYQGATLAMSSYPPPLNFVMAAATVASGLGQVAQIKAQSFEGGGFTGKGSRSGGIDGTWRIS
jgi:hypothetical protein